jgi:hypothetical protein
MNFSYPKTIHYSTNLNLPFLRFLILSFYFLKRLLKAMLFLTAFFLVFEFLFQLRVMIEKNQQLKFLNEQKLSLLKERHNLEEKILAEEKVFELSEDFFLKQNFEKIENPSFVVLKENQIARQK